MLEVAQDGMERKIDDGGDEVNDVCQPDKLPLDYPNVPCSDKSYGELQICLYILGGLHFYLTRKFYTYTYNVIDTLIYN